MLQGDYLFLDDIRTPISTRHVSLPHASWKVVRDYKAFCHAVNDYYNKYGDVPPFIAFDHDLDAEHYRDSMFGDPARYNDYYDTFKEKTGLDCAKWLVEFCRKKGLAVPDWICHSMNPVGKANIDALMTFGQNNQHEWINL